MVYKALIVFRCVLAGCERLSVRPSVGRSVGWFVRPSISFYLPRLSSQVGGDTFLKTMGVRLLEGGRLLRRIR